MNKLTIVAITMGVLWSFPAAVQQTGAVVGVLCSAATNSAAPGVTVSLVHPSIGRSASSITDQYGRFGIFNVPIAGDPYFLEAYWGQQLIYRTAVVVQGSVDLQRICI